MVVICPKCHAENTKDSKYCRNCGTDISSIQPIADKTDEQIKKVIKTSKTVVFKVVSTIFILIAIGIAGVVGKVAVQAAIEPSAEEKKAAMIQQLQKFADNTNPTLPVMVDDITQMDQITIGPDLRIVYHQSLPKYSVNELDQDSLDTYRTTVVNNICSKEETKELLRENGLYQYIVKDKNGVAIADVIVSKNDCNL
jgi:hypothetical protein